MTEAGVSFAGNLTDDPEQQRCRHRSRLPQDRSSRTLVTTRKSVRHTINVAEESAVSAAREA